MKIEFGLNKLKGMLLEDILSFFSRDYLRDLAKANDIERGRNKIDTIINIEANKHKLPQDFTITIEVNHG